MVAGESAGGLVILRYYQVIYLPLGAILPKYFL